MLFPLDSTRALIMRGNGGGFSYEFPVPKNQTRSWIRAVNLAILRCASEESYGAECKWLERLQELSKGNMFLGHPFFGSSSV